ncbi:TonB-dependent receptor [Colwelliaceae bacterium MEBiC 14330]
MSTQTFKKGVLASSIAMILAGTSSQAMAAEEAASQVSKDEVEVIEVTGIRGSMKENINAKRFADSVVDVVTAEDIGKFPDKNVADSLARITGVSVSREFGEGEQISIRGAGPKYNRTLLNGQSVGTADWFILDEASRSFNYTLLPSVIVKTLEVHKSPTAVIDEGSIGGTVILKTRRPLEMDANTVSLALEAAYSDASEETDPSVNAMYSWKNEDETIGVMVSAVRQDRTVQREGFEVLSWQENDGGVVPGNIGVPLFNQDRERTTFFATLQAAPTDELLITFNALNSEMDANNKNSNLLTFSNAETDIANATKVGSDGAVLATSNPTGNVAYNYINRISSTETAQYHLDVDYEADDFSLNFEIGTTSAKGGTYRETSWEFVAREAGYDYDLTGTPNVDFGVDGADASAFVGGWIWGGEKPTTDDEDFVQLDLEVPVDLGIVTAIKTGVKYRDAARTQDRNVYSWHAPFTNGGDQDNYFAHIFDSCPTLASCDLDAVGTVNVDVAATGDITSQVGHNRAVMEQIAFGGVNGIDATYAISQQLADIWDVEEQHTSFYVQADFAGDNFRGNFGVRYVSTDQTSYGYEFSNDSWGFNTINGDWLAPSTLNWVSVDNDYSEVLPSLNVTYDLAEDQMIRFSASKVMSRQNWADISSSSTYGSLNGEDPQGTRGNPYLDPTLANQIDLGYEWYYGEASMFAATLFWKDIDSLRGSIAITEPVLNEETGQLVDVDFNQPVNGPGGTISGIELGLQHDFGDFGFSANYTYTNLSADGERDITKPGSGLIDGTSENMANLTAYYENDDFGARLMYNYRSDWYTGLHFNGDELWTEGFGQLDASGTYNLNENISFTLEAINLTDEEVVQYNTEKDRVMSIYANGRRIVAGVRINF